jgi:hypothetical protein
MSYFPLRVSGIARSNIPLLSNTTYTESLLFSIGAKPHTLLGTWNYMNGTYSGKIVYSDYGNFTLTIPTKNAFGNYKSEGSWGSLGPNILTECYPYGSCENNTIITTSPNHIKFKDSHDNMIHLTSETK